MSHRQPEDSPAEDEQEKNTVVRLAYSPTGDRVVGGTTEGTLLVWDAQSGDCILGPLNGQEELGIITHVCFATDDLILSASYDSTLHLWDASSGEPIDDPFKQHEDAIVTAACLPDQRTVASLSKDGIVYLWDRHTLETIHDFRVDLDSSVVAAFSHDGTKLMAIQRETCRIWDVERGENIAEFSEPSPSAMQLCAAFSFDSTQVILGYGDDVLRCWDVESGEMVGVSFEGHDDVLSYVVCSPDGKYIASAACNAKIHVWDAETHESLVQMDGDGPLAFSPDGQHLARATDGNQLIIDELNTLLKKDSLESLLDLPATQIPGAPMHSLSERMAFGDFDLGPLPQFAAISASSGRALDGKERTPREKVEMQPLWKAGNWISRLRRAMPRHAPLDNGENHASDTRDNEQVQRTWIAPARDKNPMAIARQSERQEQKMSRQQRDKGSGGTSRGREQIELDSTETPSSSSGSQSETEQTSEHGVRCCAWPRFK